MAVPLNVIINEQWASNNTINETRAKAAEAGYVVSRRYIQNAFGKLNSIFNEFCESRADRVMQRYNKS